MDLTSIKGIGPKVNEILRLKGISDTKSLVSFFPKDYRINKISRVSEKEFNAYGVIASNIELIKPKNVPIILFDIIIDNVMYKAKAFNMSYISKVFNTGDKVVVCGIYDSKYKTITVKKLYKENEYKEGISPIYDIEGVNSPLINKAINLAIDEYEEELNIIPKEYYLKHAYKYGIDLLKTIHNPKNINDIKICRDSLKYNELIRFACKIELIREKEDDLRREPIKYDLIKVKELINSIPFELSNDQKRSVNDIFIEFNSGKPLNMLLEGDTGSGKTIVSVISSYAMVLANKQVLVFAPTEALCYQHYKTFNEYLNKFNVNIKLLTSSTKAKDRDEIIDGISNGSIDILIGTQSLLNDEVKFKDLAFVVLDEQHKAGVNQRRILREKGKNTDILYMSATPIPRTLALTLFNDMKLEEIHSRKDNNVRTFVHTYKEYLKVLEFIDSEIKNKHQAYFVCPVIDDNDNEVVSVNRVKNDLVEYYSNKYNIEVLHGKLTDNEKLDILDRFNNGEIDILVSTTVIEVGINNINASSIVILDSNRFGLSQLHQLRGRVGRGDDTGYCFLMVESMIDQSKLSFLEECNDGFMISEADLKYRGPGDFLGVNQSGDINFKYSNIVDDKDIFNICLKDAKELLNNKLIKDYFNNLIDKDNFD